MITVVIPLYNKAHTIVETLKTVLNQSFTDFEVIIVDDGSVDNGVDVIRANFNDNRIRIISQVNQGVSVARDKGVKESRSNYIAFLDADDKWHVDYLKIMNETISKYPDCAIYSSGGLIQNGDGKIYYRLVNRYLNRIEKVNFFTNPFAFTHTSGTIINKTYFLKTDGSPVGMKNMQDFALFVQLALVGDFVYVGYPISKYVGGVQGQTTSAKGEARFKYMKYVVFFHNLLYAKAEIYNNKYAFIFLKYNLRHLIKHYFVNKDFKSLDYMLNNLSRENIKQFNHFELFLFKNKIRSLSLLWINFSKLVWRLHGFPRVGERVEIDKIDKKYMDW